MTVPSVCLVVLDGWGIAPDGPGNAISLAATPVFDELWQRYPHSQLTTWGPGVGLPERQMGNSEVGHMNLGAGAVVKQDLTRIDDAVDDGTLAHNDILRAAVDGAPRVHLIGLVSDGGVHSGWSHLEALVAVAAEAAPARLGHGLPGAVAALVRARRQRPRGLGRRALLGDGSRQALGPHPEGVRPAGPRPRPVQRRHCGPGGEGRVRAR